MHEYRYIVAPLLSGELMHSTSKGSNGIMTQFINNHLKMKYPLRILSGCYTAKQIKNCMKSISVTKAATMKSTDAEEVGND